MKTPLTEKQKERMRVRVAKDVLLQLSQKKLTPACGTYTSGLEQMVPARVDGQRFLKSKKFKKCTACAIGAGFIAMVRLEDRWKGGQYPRHHERLKKYFDFDQLFGIEASFECWFKYRDLNHWNKIGSKYRMRWIWNFVLKQKGKFTANSLLYAVRKREDRVALRNNV